MMRANHQSVAPKYAAAHGFLAFAMVFAAWRFWAFSPAIGLGLGYLAVSFLALGIAYGCADPRLFGKRGDGRISWGSRILLGPYFLLNGLTFAIYRRTSTEPAFAAVAPNLDWGRRLTSAEVRRAGVGRWTCVLDLTCEFAEVPELRRVPRYLALPLLDAAAPSAEALAIAERWVAESARLGPTYVHCALGHGRGATVVLARLLRAGSAPTIEEGLRMLRVERPGVDLNARQRRALEAWAASS